MKFDREQILNRYWELANLPPQETKDNITGQLKALDSLLEALAAKPAATAAKAAPFYRAAWMDHSHDPRNLDARHRRAASRA
jgi:hypothetical protein